MRTVRRFLPAIFLALALPFSSSIARAGGGAPPGQGGGGVGAGAAAVIGVDHPTVANHTFDFLDFFPRSAAVHQGDVVTFHWDESNGNTFHTVTFVPAGVGFSDQALNRIFPGGGAPSPDSDDPRQPGPPKLSLPFNAFQQRCGDSSYFPGTGPCPYTGRSVINSGVLGPNAIVEKGQFLPTLPLRWSVRMNVAPGTYHFFCLVHGPKMNGSITVLPATAPTPSPAQQVARAQTQYQSELATAFRFENQLTARYSQAQSTQGGHTTWHAQAGGVLGRIEILEFFPKVLAPKAGDTVIWSSSPELHTITFPRFAGIPAFSFECESPGKDRPFTGNFATCPGTEAVTGPAFFPSRPSGQPYAGGFASSGVLVVPRPHPWIISFTKPGTYLYQCAIHWNMLGTVTVH